MEALLLKFKNLIEENGVTMAELGFAPGASDDEIHAVETITQQMLPADAKYFLSKINGQKTNNFHFLIDEVKLLSCEKIIAAWIKRKENWEKSAEINDGYNHKVKNKSFGYKSRIPFASEDGNGMICIDNSHEKGSVKCQIIFMFNEYNHIVLADSFKGFISCFVMLIEKSILKFKKENNSNKFKLRSDDYYISDRMVSELLMTK